MAGRTTEMKPYPTDNRGFPVSPLELGFIQVEVGRRTNTHHLNFHRRRFIQFAISRTFRDLEDQQFMMWADEHTELHRRYGGIVLPKFVHMLDEIGHQQSVGGMLRILNQDTMWYATHPITDELVGELKQEYQQVGNRE